MKKTLTKDQQDKITKLYRECGWPIKKIAKHLHIGDKRVSAFLRGNECDQGKCQKKTDIDEFNVVVNELSKGYETSCDNFVTAIHDFVLDVFVDVLVDRKNDTKKAMKKRFDDRLNKLYDAILNVTFSAGCAAIFQMPARFKKLWIENCKQDPKRLTGNGNKPKSAKKK